MVHEFRGRHTGLRRHNESAILPLRTWPPARSSNGERVRFPTVSPLWTVFKHDNCMCSI